MDWPAQSPDLNPIEKTLGRCIAEFRHYPSIIGEGTSMSSPSRVEENTTSCHTRTCGKYAQSPDLNPIEKPWDALHRRIQALPVHNR
ncbi:hypothetical protein CEXT_541451 [Caerostris extrusa]|uniref:Tc1-like transposase DDE domain-containing protein n=1 Tax=Caerostris extrusa TaxID=172846 RepID=A0AAV4XQY7_CAEEX|nr:hypothetical protein CEXT_541451 [Caerostris extrusa]